MMICFLSPDAGSICLCGIPRCRTVGVGIHFSLRFPERKIQLFLDAFSKKSSQWLQILPPRRPWKGDRRRIEKSEESAKN
jgi:hypothetical protein